MADGGGDAGADDAELGHGAPPPDEEGVEDDVGDVADEVGDHDQTGVAASGEEAAEGRAEGEGEVGDHQGEVVALLGGEDIGRVAHQVEKPEAQRHGGKEDGHAGEGEPEALAHGAGAGGAAPGPGVLRHKGAGVGDDVLQQGDDHEGDQPGGQRGLDADGAVVGQEEAVHEHHQRVAGHRQHQRPGDF